MKKIIPIYLILLSFMVLTVHLSKSESKGKLLIPEPEPRVIYKKIFVPKKIFIKKPVYITRIIPKKVIKRVYITKFVPKPVYITKKVFIPKPIYIKKKYHPNSPPIYQSLLEEKGDRMLGEDPRTWSPFPSENEDSNKHGKKKHGKSS